jgi:uncharacterized membrane protein
MGSRLRLRGNAVQPLLLMFPLGLVAVAMIFDVSHLGGAPAILGTVAYWNIVAGLVGGGLAAAVLWIDSRSTPHRAAARLGVFRFLLDLAVLIVFAVILLLRVRTADRTADPGLVVVELAGMLTAGFAAWFGGRLGEPAATAARGGRLRQPAATAARGDRLREPPAATARARHAAVVVDRSATGTGEAPPPRHRSMVPLVRPAGRTNRWVRE